jgi:DNA repair exonuclease SbcCD ATPase subunit
MYHAAMDPEYVLDIVPADVEAIDKYREEKPQTFSAQIFSRILSGGAVDDIIPFKPTPAARIAVARTVIAASDQKIDDLEKQLKAMRLERDQSLVNRVLVAINTPVFAPGKKGETSQPEETPEGKEKKLEEAENRWFLRYLTLRNILAFLAVFVGLVGSVFAFSVNTYDKRANDLNLTIASLAKQKGELEGKKGDLEKQVLTLQGECGPQLTAKKSELEAANKQVQALNANIDQTNKLLAAAQAAATRSEEQANLARKDAAVLQQKLNDLQAAPKN